MWERIALFLGAVVLLCGGIPLHAQQNPAPVPQWIWSPDDAPRLPDTVFFRFAFKLPQKPVRARILIVADDLFNLNINESKQPVATGNDWTTVQEFDVTPYLKAKSNLLAIEATNTAGAAGLLFKLVVTLPEKRTLTFVSDQTVRTERRPPPIWTTLTYDDTAWLPAKEIAPVNGGVWGTLRAAAMPDPTRIVRKWNILASASPETNPYIASRSVGDRMLLSTNISSVSDMQILGKAGFTLFQTDSNHLSTNETAPGKWDWNEIELQRKAAQKAGLDWVYFPHFAFPPTWYREKNPFTRIECLEHKQPAQAFSLWEPRWAGFVDQGYTALAKEFHEAEKGDRVLSALCVGVHGDYGEAGLLFGGRTSIPSQKEDWQKQFGDVHDHLGYWCNDPLARAHFRATMLKKYGSLEKLNRAWKREFKNVEAITYPEKPRPDARREWLDFIRWYKESVGSAIETNLSTARKHFPNTLLMLPAGFADEDPRGGNDNSLIPAIASRFKAEVRSTHSAFKPFAENASTMFARLGSACRFYKVPFWVEPQSGLTAEQEVGRIFETVSQGAKGLFDWSSNALRHRDVYYRYGKYLHIEKPIVDVAMFYPAEAQELRTDQGYHPLFAQACAYLRDVMNYDIVDDRMVRDGCLSKYRVLVLWEGTLAEPEVLEKIKQWVNEGGVLLAYDYGKITTFEGDTTWFDEMFGYSKELARARVNEKYVGETPTHYQLKVGQPESSDYLFGDWFEAEGQGNDLYRWMGNTAGLLLPVDPDKRYVLVIRASVPEDATELRRHVSINGHEVGMLSSSGDVTYRFLIPQSLLGDNPLARLSFQSQTFQLSTTTPNSRDQRKVACQIYSIELIEQNTRPVNNPLPPPGSIQRELDLRQLNGNWARRYGKGLTIFFPGRRNLLRGYLEVIRKTTYNLSRIDPGRRDALPVDVGQDGVYATLFTDKILYYNSTNMTVTKNVTISPELFEQWKGEIATPTETSWKITLEPHSMSAIYLGTPPQELLFECEEFTELAGARVLSDPRNSPGLGVTSVRIPAQASISTRFRIETPGQYTIFTRTTRNNAPEPVEILIDDQPVTLINTKAGQSVLSGVLSLPRGTHRLTLRAYPKREVLADFVILTNDPTITGYDFAVRIPPIE